MGYVATAGKEPETEVVGVWILWVVGGLVRIFFYKLYVHENKVA